MIRDMPAVEAELSGWVQEKRLSLQDQNRKVNSNDSQNEAVLRAGRVQISWRSTSSAPESIEAFGAYACTPPAVTLLHSYL